MKSVRRLAMATALTISLLNGFGQARSGSVFSNPQIAAADFVNAFQQADWKLYSELSHPAAVKYYGGLRGFTDQMQRNRQSIATALSTEGINVQQLSNDGNQWQCIITVAGCITSDQADAGMLIGQSEDNGKTWNFIDLSLFPKAAMPYLIPELIEGLVFPGNHFNDSKLRQLVKTQ